MAIGIDSIAHEAALDAGLITVAFPGSGLLHEVLYPPSRRGLAERIVTSGGALISSFKPDQMGAPWTFPVRNRWMAGMSHAVLIIEGREGSGTMGTATYATELNRNVLIVPGSMFSDLSHGPLMLMKDGATPVTSGEEVLNELGFAEDRLIKVPRSPERLAAMLAKRKKLEEMRLAGKILSGPTKNSGVMRVNLDALSLSIEERKICELLKNGPANATELIRFLADEFEVGRSNIEIVSGQTSKIKTLKIIL
jgi:predicted Rossmann fold nucleotide-binding protein DprA/Smf involved in DNA uptake